MFALLIGVAWAGCPAIVDPFGGSTLFPVAQEALFLRLTGAGVELRLELETPGVVDTELPVGAPVLLTLADGSERTVQLTEAVRPRLPAAGVRSTRWLVKVALTPEDLQTLTTQRLTSVAQPEVCPDGHALHGSHRRLRKQATCVLQANSRP